MYEAHYINPLYQYGYHMYELILEDPTLERPTIRHWVKFHDTVTDDEMLTRAEEIIDEVVAAQDAAALAQQ